MAGNVQLRRMDRVLKWLSIATLTALAVTAVLRRLPSPALPVWWTEWTLPVLTAAAVGYLTNYLAIWMLFRPYEPKRLWHWRFQGVIPRHKEEIGRLLGEDVRSWKHHGALRDQYGFFDRDPPGPLFPVGAY